MVFQCINIRQVPWEVLKTAASGLGFQHLPWDLVNVNTWKTMFDPYIENDICCVEGPEIYVHSNGELDSSLLCFVSRETSNYHRCGRTDKGVSAFGQVISVDLRTNLTSGVGVKVREGGSAHERPGDKTVEIRYVHILNKVLPSEIRVLAWAPVDTDFSARWEKKTWHLLQ